MKKRHNTTSTSVLNARYLRKQSTSSEKKLWGALRSRRLADYKFRRQYPVGSWIVDFFCLEKMAGVEIDGPVHRSADENAHDRAREERLLMMGIRILRISADSIEKKCHRYWKISGFF